MRMSSFIVLALACVACNHARKPSRAPSESAAFTSLFREVPKDWVRYEGRTFSMMMPPGLVRADIAGEDSVTNQFTGPRIRIDISEGPYAGGFHEPNRLMQEEYRVEDREVDGWRGHLVRFKFKPGAAPGLDGRYAATVDLRKNDQPGESSIGLSVGTYSLTAEDRSWAVTALRSIRISPKSKKR